MVSGADKIFGSYTAPSFTVGGKESFVRKVNPEYKQVVQGPNYAKYDGGVKPNYEQFDTYQRPVTDAKFDMIM